MNKGRLEAFTDAIIAIAATIMVLELHAPATNDWRGLLEEWPTLQAYIVSFALIYIVWYNHHNLFQKAAVITRRTYMVNGLWVFFLTLIPFTTGWVGSAPAATLPEAAFSANLLLWSLMFQLLDRQILRDNPDAEKDHSNRLFHRLVMYGGFGLSILLAFFRPNWSLHLVAVVVVVLAVRLALTREARAHRA